MTTLRRLNVQLAVVGVLFALAIVSVAYLVPYLVTSLEQPSQAWGFLALLGLLPTILVLALLLWVTVSALLKEMSESGTVSKLTSLRVTLLVGVAAVSVLAALLLNT